MYLYRVSVMSTDVGMLYRFDCFYQRGLLSLDFAALGWEARILSGASRRGCGNVFRNFLNSDSSKLRSPPIDKIPESNSSDASRHPNEIYDQIGRCGTDAATFLG